MAVAADVTDIFELNDRSIFLDDRTLYVDHGLEWRVSNGRDKNVLRRSTSEGDDQEDNRANCGQEGSRTHTNPQKCLSKETKAGESSPSMQKPDLTDTYHIRLDRRMLASHSGGSCFFAMFFCNCGDE
jgi:hypothetical protein